jgi:hypothetical protein
MQITKQSYDELMHKLKLSNDQRNKLQEQNSTLLAEVEYCRFQHPRLADEHAKLATVVTNFEKQV